MFTVAIFNYSGLQSSLAISSLMKRVLNFMHNPKMHIFLLIFLYSLLDGLNVAI